MSSVNALPQPTHASRHSVSRGGGDTALVYTTIALLAVGLMSVYTASAVQADLETGNSMSLLIKQCIALVVGLGVMRLVQQVPVDFFNRVARPLGIASLFCLALTFVIGTTANGSERWIPLPFGFSFQPSDLAKVAAILLMAQGLTRPRLFNPQLFGNLALIGVMLVLILKQPNLSVTMIVSCVTFLMLIVSGLPRAGILAALCGIGGVAYWEILHTSYQMKRIQGWLNPWASPLEIGYNLIQSYYAIGSGGLWGAGLGNSVQKLFYLPFQHTDFIFSVICEEWGFFGAVIVIGLFGLLAWRGFCIAWRCPHPFGRYAAFGLTLSLIIQAYINIAVTTGLMPVTGVTLPLISYGGTSLIVTLMMIGMLLNISRLKPISYLGPVHEHYRGMA